MKLARTGADVLGAESLQTVVVAPLVGGSASQGRALHSLLKAILVSLIELVFISPTA